MDKDFLIQQLKDMGLKSTDNLLLHSSMKAIGNVSGGADTVVDAFVEYLCDGMFMTPTHTWKQMSEDYNIFDPKTEESCVGIITNVFRQRDGVYRSLHPTHSMAAIGADAKVYIMGEELFNTPCNPRGCYGRLKDINAKILLAGVTHAKNTYIHSIEESFDIKERLTDKPTTFYVKNGDDTITVNMHRHFNAKEAHISETFDKLADYYIDMNAAKKVRFGNADCLLCDAAKLFDATKKVLLDKPDFFIPYEN